MNNFDTCNGLIYTIKQGDTLYMLSGRFRVPLALILRANPYADIYNLQIGDRICIPVLPGQLPMSIITYIIQNNESLMDILDRFNIDLNDFMRYNNLKDMKLMPGAVINLPDMNNTED